MFVGINHASKLAFTQLVGKACRRTAWKFLAHLQRAAPHRTRTVMTDDGSRFTEQPDDRNTASPRQTRCDMTREANCRGHIPSAHNQAVADR